MYQNISADTLEIPQSWVAAFSKHKKKEILETRNDETYLYKFDPLNLHFYIVKLRFTELYIFFLFLLKNIDLNGKTGFTGVYIIFLTSAQKIDCVTR